jgi:hypothetical protein
MSLRRKPIRKAGAVGAMKGKVKARSALKKRKLLPSQRGFQRTSGMYGRFGVQAAVMGNIPEDKYFDIDVGAFGLNTTPQGSNVLGISQGVGASQRVGRACRIKSMQYFLRAYAPDNSANGFTADHVTAWIVQDRQCNGAGMSFSDVFHAANVSSSMLFRLLSNSSRFRVLKRIDLNVRKQVDSTGLFGGNSFAIDQGFLALNMPQEYSGSTGAITEIKTNTIGVFIVSDWSDNYLYYQWHIRFKFTDL